MHRLRLNRHLQLKGTKHGQENAEFPTCEHCATEDEKDTEHFLYCPRREAERNPCRGNQPDLKLLQTALENVLKFIQKTDWAFLAPYFKIEGRQTEQQQYTG